MGSLLQDLRYGLRMLAKNPGFTTVAVLTLALGIGANTAVFSVVNGVLLRPLSYPEPDRLMMIHETSPQFDQMSVTYPNFQDWQRENRSFESIGAYRNDDFNFTGSGEAERVQGEMVSAEFFPVLGVKAEFGRAFSVQEDRLGVAGLAVLSHGFWKRRFAANPSVLGTSLALNGKSYNVVGVLPPTFRFRDQADVYVPVGQWDDPLFRDRLNHAGLHVLGRLKPRVTLQQAQADMTAIARALAQEYPKTNATQGCVVVPMRDDMIGNVRRTLFLLLGAVGFVLLIACANVASLLLARSTARKREFAIRAALGAGRFRVLRQLLTESVLLAVAGGGLGLVFASWGMNLVLTAVPDSLPRAEEVGLDLRVLAFTLGASILTGILFGLAPALQSLRDDPQESLKEGGRGITGRAAGFKVRLSCRRSRWPSCSWSARA